MKSVRVVTILFLSNLRRFFLSEKLFLFLGFYVVLEEEQPILCKQLQHFKLKE